MTNKKRDNSAPNQGGPWLNADQAADYLGLPTTRALYQCVRRGEIPSYRLGKRLRFKRVELDAKIEQGRQLTADDARIS